MEATASSVWELPENRFLDVRRSTAVDLRSASFQTCSVSVEVITMAYNEALATRVRQALRERKEVVEKSMFGGVAFMVAGNMCCGVNRDDLIIRLDRHMVASDLGSPRVRAWDFMKRPMPGMFAVDGAGCSDQKSVDSWIKLALAHALSLPPKSAGTTKKAGPVRKKAK
jgi:TfoX/Sxy family transcriptional regulator of competence genes